MESFEGKRLRIKHGYIYRGKKLFHRELWERAHGAIPEGYCIHHKDGNKLNNSLENLECMKIKDHMRLHALENSEKLSRNMKRDSTKIHAWLKTDKGKIFLSLKAKKEWERRQIKSFRCEHCKKEFQSKHNTNVRFCGDNCVMAARNKSGVDNVTRLCVICENPFIINRYQRTKTCSFLCRNGLISRLKSK